MPDYGLQKNSEGYSDPTACAGMSKVLRDENDAERRAKALIGVIRSITDLAGFSLLCRIEIRDKKNRAEIQVIAMGYDDVKSWLYEYQGLKFEYDSWRERQQRLENEQYIPEMRMGDGSKRNPGANDRMGNATVRRILFEEETSEEINAIKEKMRAIETAIKSLPDPMHRGVLIQRYIIGRDGYKPQLWADIAFKMFRRDDESAEKMAQRYHRAAVESLEVLMNEKNDMRL